MRSIQLLLLFIVGLTYAEARGEEQPGTVTSVVPVASCPCIARGDDKPDDAPPQTSGQGPAGAGKAGQ